MDKERLMAKTTSIGQLDDRITGLDSRVACLEHGFEEIQAGIQRIEIALAGDKGAERERNMGYSRRLAVLSDNSKRFDHNMGDVADIASDMRWIKKSMYGMWALMLLVIGAMITMATQIGGAK